jgi:hypothetical protein
LTVVLRRVVADSRPDEDRPAPAAPPAVRADLGERRLGWLAVAAAVAVVVVAAMAVTSLPTLRGSARSTIAVPAATAPAVDSAGPLSAPPPVAAEAARPSAQKSGQPDTPPAAGTQPTVPVGTLLPPAPTAAPGPETTTQPLPGVPVPTAKPVPTTVPPPGIQTAIADLRAEIRKQVNAGNVEPSASGDLQSRVNQVAREANEGDVAAARSHAVKIREMLGKYRDGGMVTAGGYQALVARVDAVISAL